jgi:hypothetical protein
MTNSLTLAQGFPVSFDNPVDVELSLAIRRYSLVLRDCARACIVSGQSALHLVGMILVLQQQVAQQLRAGLDVLFRVIRIGVKGSGSLWHQLHYAYGPFWRDRILPVRRLRFSYFVHELRREAVLQCGFLHQFSRALWDGLSVGFCRIRWHHHRSPNRRYGSRSRRRRNVVLSLKRHNGGSGQLDKGVSGGEETYDVACPLVVVNPHTESVFKDGILGAQGRDAQYSCQQPALHHVDTRFDVPPSQSVQSLHLAGISPRVRNQSASLSPQLDSTA